MSEEGEKNIYYHVFLIQCLLDYQLRDLLI